MMGEYADSRHLNLGTWDKELMRKRGEALGAEFRGKGVHVALGPCVGAYRKPLIQLMYKLTFPQVLLASFLLADETGKALAPTHISKALHLLRLSLEYSRAVSLLQQNTTLATSKNISDKGPMRYHLISMTGHCTRCICGRSKIVLRLVWVLSCARIRKSIIRLHARTLGCRIMF